MEDLETIIMELLVNAGSARSAALTALQLARKGPRRASPLLKQLVFSYTSDFNYSIL